MTIAVYHVDTGAILRRVTCPADMVSAQLSAGEEFYLNCPTDATHIIDNVPVCQPQVHDLMPQIRATRYHRLCSSDWTQMPDVPLTPEQKQAWAEYRQQLRDFPSICDPDNPIWPTPPQ